MDIQATSPSSDVSSCSKCVSATKEPEANHYTCRKHRICCLTSNYDPHAYDICTHNRDLWRSTKDVSAILKWRSVLATFQKNNKNILFHYGKPFKEFFDVDSLVQEISPRPTTPQFVTSHTDDDSFNLRLQNSDVIKEMRESLQLLTQHLLPQNTASQPSTSEQRPSPNRSRSFLKSSRRYSTPSPSHSLDRQDFNRESRSRSPISYRHDHDFSTSPDQSPQNIDSQYPYHPFDVLDPYDFKTKDLHYVEVINNNTFFEFHPRMLIDEQKGIFLNDEWIKFARHPTLNAFRLIHETEEASAFLISNSSSTEAIKKRFKREVMPNHPKIGSCNKAFKVNVKKAPAFLEMIKPLERDNEKILTAILTNDHSTLGNVFHHFKSPADFSFDEGWTLSTDFKTFSKPDCIKVIDSAIAMSSRETPFIPDKYLKKEKDLRMSIVDTLSGFYSLTFTAEESNDLALQKMQLTTFKQFYQHSRIWLSLG